jgi:hypothetical protein
MHGDGESAARLTVEAAVARARGAAVWGAIWVGWENEPMISIDEQQLLHILAIH